MRRQDAAILAALQSQGLDQARLDDVAAQLEFTTWDLALRPFLSSLSQDIYTVGLPKSLADCGCRSRRP